MCTGKLIPMGPRDDLWGVELLLCNPSNPARATVVSDPRSTQAEAERAIRELSQHHKGCLEPRITMARRYVADPNFFVEAARHNKPD